MRVRISSRSPRWYTTTGAPLVSPDFGSREDVTRNNLLAVNNLILIGVRMIFDVKVSVRVSGFHLV